MKLNKVKAFQSWDGKLYSNKDEFIRAEIGNLMPVDTKLTVVEAIIANGAVLRALLHVPQKRGPRKSKTDTEAPAFKKSKK